jgi:hypothetical protein
MTEYVTGQIYGWNGGECPVHFKDVVNAWCRGGAMESSPAGSFSWTHFDFNSDIIAFQVITPYAEPKVIWVNEYEDGHCKSYPSKEAAEAWAKLSAIRVAVKYVEVKE